MINDQKIRIKGAFDASGEYTGSVYDKKSGSTLDFMLKAMITENEGYRIAGTLEVDGVTYEVELFEQFKKDWPAELLGSLHPAHTLR